jgi:hypothetical protein
MMPVAGWMGLLSPWVVFELGLGAMVRRMFGDLVETVPMEIVQ